MRKRVFRQPANQEWEQTISQQNAAKRAEKGQRESFGEQLTLNPPARGSNRAANGKLMLTGCAAGKQQDGNVGATDEQEKRHRSEQQVERAAQTFLKLFIEPFDVYTKLLREVTGSFFG